MTIIKDGRGSGNNVRVGPTYRIYTDALTRTDRDIAALTGDAFNINTGSITLTSANESGVLYVKNDSTDHLVCSQLVYMFAGSTGGSGSGEVYVYRNPTEGTLRSGASTSGLRLENKNHGSNKPVDGEVFRGAEGNTVTDGDIYIETFLGIGSTARLELGYLVLPQGTSLAVTVIPPAGNTSMDIKIALAVNYIDPDVVS